MSKTIKLLVVFFLAGTALALNLASAGAVRASEGRFQSRPAGPAFEIRAAPIISGTKVDVRWWDHDGDGRTDPGDRLLYRIVIRNSGDTTATGVTFSDTVDAHTTYVPGSVNVSPLALDDNYQAVGNTLLAVGVAASGDPELRVPAQSLFDNDREFLGDTFFLDSFDATSAQGGTVNVNADGTFTYLPPAGTTGTDTFGYVLRDAGGLTGTGHVTITISERVWYVDNGGTNGDGRSTGPFNSLAAAQAAAVAGDVIFVYQGSAAYNGGISLQNTQALVGEGVPLVVGGHNLYAAGTPPTLVNSTADNGGHGVRLAAGNDVRGLTVGDTPNGAALGDGGASVGTLTVAAVTVQGTGALLELANGGTLDASFESLATTSAGWAVHLNGVGGSLAVTNDPGAETSIAGATLGGIRVSNAPAGANLNFGDTVINATDGPGVDLATNAATAGIAFTSLNVTTANGAGLRADTGGQVTLSGTSNSINATGGAALSAINTTVGAGGWTFSTLSSSGSPDEGVYLVGMAGSIIANGGSIGSSSSTAFRVSGGNGTVVYAGSINNSAGRLVDVQGRTAGAVTLSGTLADTGTGINVSGNTGGSVTFSGASKVLNTGANVPVSLSNNAGATVNFTNGGLDVHTTAGTTGFFASHSGTVNVSGANNTVNAPGARALDLDNTALGITLARVDSVGGSVPGIDLDTTTGSLTVTGDGTDTSVGGNGSGGTIANKTGSDGSANGVGVWLNNAQGVTLQRMQLNDFHNFAIRGTGVTGFALAYSTVSGTNGTSAVADEGSISFDNLLGSAALTNCNVSGGYEDNILVTNDTGTLDRLVVTGTTIGANGTNGNDGLLVEAQNAAIVRVTVDGSTFTAARGDLFQANGLGTSTMDVVFTNNTLSNNHSNIVSGGGGVTFSGGGATANINYTYVITGNTFRDAVGNAVTANFVAGSGTVSGNITGNTIGVAGVTGSGSLQGSGILIGASENVVHSVIVDGNVIREIVGWNGIDVAANVDGNFNATITDNDVALSDAVTDNIAVLYALVGGAGTETGTLCLDVRGNTFNANNALYGNAVCLDQVSTAAHYNLPGYTGSPSGESGRYCAGGTASADIDTYLSGRTNTMFNGLFPPYDGDVDAGLVCGVTGVGTGCGP